MSTQETVLSDRTVSEYAIVGYLALTSSSDRPEPDADQMFAVFLRTPVTVQRWRFLRAVSKENWGPAGLASPDDFAHILRDGAVMGRIRDMELMAAADLLNKYAMARRDLADARELWVQRLAGKQVFGSETENEIPEQAEEAPKRRRGRPPREAGADNGGVE